MSFENIKNELTSEEMRLIMAGSGSSGGQGGYTPGPGFPGNPNPIYLPPVVITPSGPTGPSDPGIPGTNPSIPGGGGTGGGGGGGGGVGGGATGDLYYYGNQSIGEARNLFNNYERQSNSFQHFSPNAMTHSLSEQEHSDLQNSMMKVMGAMGMAVDSHNFTTSIASLVYSEVGVVLQHANVATGITSIALGGYTAVNNIINNGGNTGDWIAVGLVIAGAIVIANPGTIVGGATASAIVSTMSFVNDAISIAGGYNNVN